MKGSVIRQKWISRKDLVSNRGTLYVFGDNMDRVGSGGQAGAMRGEPNAVGVPTKWSPGMSNRDFFSDSDMSVLRPVLDREFDKLRVHIQKGGNVVIPADGLGTGLSELPTRAPFVLDYIESKINELVDISNE